MTDALDEYIISSKDSTTIILSDKMPAEYLPTVGDIVYCLNTKATPYGFSGRVVSIKDDNHQIVIKTEKVLLNEIFKELHISQSILLPENITYMIDSEGNKVDCKVVANEVWNEISSYDETTSTKAEYHGNISQTFELGSKDCEYFDGGLYLGLSLDLVVDIT